MSGLIYARKGGLSRGAIAAGFAALPASAPSTVPAAPVIGFALANNGQAVVNWTIPTNAGPLTSHTVTASPGGATAAVDGKTNTATVTGLTNGTAYTFTVVATNVVGSSAASAATNSVTPSPDPGGLGIQGCVTWLRADKIPGPPSNGAQVATWPDSSGNGFDAVQPTSANKPTFLSSWTNSKPALTFDGSAFTMLMGITQAKIGSRMTVFIVWDMTASSGDRRLWCNQLNANDSAGNLIDTNGGAQRTIIAGGSALSQTLATNTPAITSLTAPGHAYLSGTKGADGTTGSVISTNPYYLASLAGGMSKFCPCRIGEVRIFNRILSDAERHLEEADMAAFWNITEASQ